MCSIMVSNNKNLLIGGQQTLCKYKNINSVFGYIKIPINARLLGRSRVF